MQPKITTNSSLNGSLNNGDYVWAGAMNLCWTNFEHTLLKGQKLHLATQNPSALKMITNFQKTLFTTKDLDSQSYYIHAGYGPSAVQTINKQCRQKFPNKTFGDLHLNLKDKDVISYAYFFKAVQYKQPFEVNQYFRFNELQVKGFGTSNSKNKSNVKIVAYKNDDDFTVKLELKQPNQELYIIKGSEKLMPQEIVDHVLLDNHVLSSLGDKDRFGMPRVKFDINRGYNELVGLPIDNEAMKGSTLGAMFENIKFEIDEIGAKVENEAVMVGITSVGNRPKPKYLDVDKPFWIVMRQKGRHPYFVSHVTGHSHMTLL